MKSQNPGFTDEPLNNFDNLYNQKDQGHNQPTGTTKKTYFFAILALVGFGGLVVGVVGLVQAAQAGALTNQAIITMATGGAGGTLLFIIGIVGLVKNRQIGNQSIEPLERTVIEGIEPLERTVIEGVEDFTVFGAREWEHFYGDVGEQPDYPKDIVDILNAQCPFSENEETKVKDTHMLVLVPATVAGEALNLNRLEELIKRPKNNGFVTNYDNYKEAVKKDHGDKASGQSYWVLMTKDVISDSKNQTYAHQVELVKKKGKEQYTLPGDLEAAVCILMEYVVSGIKQFPADPITYTSCSTTLNENSFIIVGGFGYRGIDIEFNDNKKAKYYLGVAALRKWLPQN